MSILIKDMEMPKCCGECPLTINTLRCVLLWDQCENLDLKLKDCPLIEVPTPHGRLIDDFKVLRAIIKAFPHKGMDFYIKLEETIDSVETIIEEEE